MLWRRLINRISGSSADGRRGAVTSRRRKTQRRLALQTLMQRQMLVGDLEDLGTISGTVTIDNNGTSVGVEDVLVRIYRDANNDGVLDGGDNLINSFVTTTDDNGTPGDTSDDIVGNYGFGGLDGDDDDGDTLADTSKTDSGQYLIEFSDNPGGDDLSGLIFPGVQVRVVTNDTGVQETVIDAFTGQQPSQPITQTVAGIATSNPGAAIAPAGSVVGGERDVEIELVSATSGDSQFQVVTGNTELVFSNGGDVQATLLVQYDGIDTLQADGITSEDNGLDLKETGLGGIDITGGDITGGLVLSVRADQAVTDGLILTVYTDDTNFSTINIDLPSSIATAQNVFVPFLDPAFVDTGAGADFTNVGAIEAFVDGVNSNGGAGAPSLDLFVAVLESRTTNIQTLDVELLQPVVIGGEVFLDDGALVNGAEIGDGIRNGGETDFPAQPVGQEIILELYELTDLNDTVGIADTPIATTTVDGVLSSGAYSFTQGDFGNGLEDLTAGFYAVVIPDDQFGAGEPLEGYRGSNRPVGYTNADDDDNTNNDGLFVTGVGFVSGAIEIVAQGEPGVGVDGTDENDNRTVDFGVLPNTDLRITKSINAGASNIVAGGNVVFDLVIENLGPLDATGVEVQDFIPDGLTFIDVRDSGGNVVATTNSTEVGGAGREIESFTIDTPA
ncbi:MAG: hypothetical protein AAF745_10745, partial [Planctomycetota bacterium]